jgi:3'-5' exoribonuclease
MSGCIRTTVQDGSVPARELHALPAPPATIATMRAGDEVHGVFACTRKDRLLSRAGTPYLAVELRDRTGVLPARAFRDADLLAGRFDKGDLVEVTGRVERFRDELQLDLRAIAAAPPGAADPASFLPVAFRDLDELDGFLEHLAGEVRDPGFRALLDGLLGDPGLRAALRRTPCTRAGHHAYLGGLLEHTVAVATLAVETSALHPRLGQDLLVTAAIVHDLGRTREFALGAEIELTDEGRLLGHVDLGLRILADRARAAGLDEPRHLALAHCVATHHGDRRPVTPEAVALLRLNALDAAVKGALEHGVAAAPGA